MINRYFDPPPALKVPPHLLAINFEVTSACNLQCAGCGRTLGMAKGSWVNKHMSKADFAKMVEHVPPTRTAVMQGIGEPTLNPDFLDILRIAHDSGKFYEIIFFTNALVRDEDYYAEASRYVDYFIISIDTLNPHFVDATRGGTDTEKLKDMVGRLLAKGLKFEISMVVSRFNAADLPSTLKILNDIGPLLVRFQMFESSEEDLPEGVLTAEEYGLLQAAIEKMRIFLPNITPTFSPLPDAVPNNQFFCGVAAPALAPFVRAQGYLTPCCRIPEPEPFGKANLATQSFAEIWESPTVRDYVHSFMEKGDPACINCYQNRRTPLTEEQSASDFHLSVERILVPAVNFLMKLDEAEQTKALILSFLRKVRDGEGDAFNKAQAIFRISHILLELGHRDHALGALDEIAPLVGPHPEVEKLRASAMVSATAEP